jgi:hypothetical protein
MIKSFYGMELAIIHLLYHNQLQKEIIKIQNILRIRISINGCLLLLNNHYNQDEG